MQERTQVQTTPPLSGVELVSQINDIAQTLGTNFSGDTDPAALAWAYATWADTASGLLKRRNAANTAWVAVAKLLAYAPDAAEVAYRSKMVGEVFYVWDHLAGAAAPSNAIDGVRFIKLTASDSYNTGMLVSETVSGSAPLVVATAVISYPDSPINGATVSLINTERRVLRAGSSGTLQDDASQSFSASFQARRLSEGNSINFSSAGGFSVTSGGGGPGARLSADAQGASLSMDLITLNTASVSALRSSTETRVRNIGVTAYMRIQ